MHFRVGILLLALLGSVSSFSGIAKYTVNDFASETPMLIFIYYESDKSKCLACSSYKKWLSSFPEKTLGVFTIKRINFNTDPIMALRFKTNSFPTFFLQHKNRFKNITDIDILEHDISYRKSYSNDIDAVLKNPRILDSVRTIEGYESPASCISLGYAYLFAVAYSGMRILDRVSGMLPSDGVVFGGVTLCLVILLSKILIRNNYRIWKKPLENAEPEKNTRKSK
ncbi:uncharacterized protein NEMAJ01_0794 [Nematocida major]|uniref:uncharacterized protein n=1 Tax=Nematocida major TaxID=1912982 RepID=UPI002008301C|nr:uncharacterized protein NEMAJ01_0794 [Nematocida major]KAH9385898.1 hypothetical protein NEMAJ01_0794 [Nematocida major]